MSAMMGYSHLGLLVQQEKTDYLCFELNLIVHYKLRCFYNNSYVIFQFERNLKYYLCFLPILAELFRLDYRFLTFQLLIFLELLRSSGNR